MYTSLEQSKDWSFYYVFDVESINRFKLYDMVEKGAFKISLNGEFLIIIKIKDIN